MNDTLKQWEAFCKQVEAELVRHGFPTLEQGHEQGLWWSIPNDLALAKHETDDPIDVARKIMWWHDGTLLTTTPPADGDDTKSPQSSPIPNKEG